MEVLPRDCPTDKSRLDLRASGTRTTGHSFCSRRCNPLVYLIEFQLDDLIMSYTKRYKSIKYEKIILCNNIKY